MSRTRPIGLTGPWPGTATVAPSDSMRRQAASQFSIGPSQTIGVPPANSRSPVKTTPSRSQKTTVSPAVCAGPRSSRRSSTPPTTSSSSPSKVRSGYRGVIPEKSKAPKIDLP